jgi:hypothetical protein
MKLIVAFRNFANAPKNSDKNKARKIKKEANKQKKISINKKGMK